MTRVNTFPADMARAIKALIPQIKQARTEAFIRVGENIIDDTPVKTGALKGSWRTTLTAPSADFMITLDGTGESPKAELRSVLSTMPFGVTAYLTNNLPYAEKAEHLGWNVTPAYRMVARNIAGFSTIGLRTGSGLGGITPWG
jgi:hypothetical protein